MSEFFVVTEPQPRRSMRSRASRDAMAAAAPSPLDASSASYSYSPSQSSDSHSPSLLHGRGVSVVHEVTDRELFATAVSVVPNLQTLLKRHAVTSRRRSSSSSSAHRGIAGSASAMAASGKNNLHWVVKKKRHGLEIKEFDRGALANTGLSSASRSSNASTSSQTPRRPAASTPRTLRTPRWCQFTRAAGADSEHQSFVTPSFASTRGSTTNESPAHRHPQLQQQCWPHCDERVAFAVSAHVELGCRLSEALELLFSTDALQFDATMSSLFGHTKYKRGDLLLAHALPHGLNVTPSDLDELVGHPHSSSTSSYSNSVDEHKLGSAFDWLERDDSLVEPAQPGWVALQSVTLRPRLNVSLPAAALRKHKLSFAAYSQVRPARDEAVYVMRTLPKELQLRVNATSEFTETNGGDAATGGEAFADEISVGYHLAGSSDMSGHQTRITMCAYVCTPELDAAGSQDGGFEHDEGSEVGTPRAPHSHHSLLARHHHNRQLRRRFECSASAKYVVSLLAAATNDLDKLLRRRRLGSQAFILTPLDKSVFQQHECHVCARRFGLLRAELFCQLCGHLVCRDCSRKFEVEPVARRVRRNRICFACVAHVDANGVIKGESEDVGEYWTRPRHRVRRDHRRGGRRVDGDAEETPAFFSTRGGRSAAGASMWNIFKSQDKDASAGAGGHTEHDAAGSRRVRRAFSMDCTDASRLGEVNDVDDLVDIADGVPCDLDAADDVARGRVRSGSGGSMTTFNGTELHSSSSPPVTPGRQLADALFSGNPLSRARALEVVRRVVQQVTQHSDEPSFECNEETSNDETYEFEAQQQAEAACSSAADRAMLRKYLEARRRLTSIANRKTGTENTATDGSCSSTPMPFPAESKVSKDASGIEDVYKSPMGVATALEQPKKKGRKKIDLLSRPWEFRLDAPRLPARSQTHISSATETEDDDDEVEDASFTSPAPPKTPSTSLDGLCEVAAARLHCPMAYVIFVGHHAPATAYVVGAFEASSVRHALSDRAAALCSVVSSALASASEPVVVPYPLADPAFQQLGEDANMNFFAGFPIRAAHSDGEKKWGDAPVAWLCAADTEPRDCVTLEDYSAIQALAKLVADLLEQQCVKA
jgi:hypothetical protein